MSTKVGVSFHSPSSDIINNLKHLDILPNQNQPLKNSEYQTNNNLMAEEFYAAAAGIYGGNWMCSPRSSMFPGIGMFSPCFLAVPNFHCPGDKFWRICDDNYGGSNSSGFSACGSDFTMDAETGFSPSALSDLNRTLFGDEEKVPEINNYVSILNELSGEDSNALLQNYLFGNSELYIKGGMLTGSFDNQNHPATSLEDHSSNLNRLSPPSLPKSTSSSKPYAVNKLRPSNKRSTSESSATNMCTVDSPTRQSQNRPNYPILGRKIQNNIEANNKRDVKNTMKRSTKMVESSVMKRPRIQTPSPLPTFKVRKEKLGDRITALQQLVSPFGKTDTASVLHESIEYIKFLQDQVHDLSTPYMKNGRAHQVHPRKPELRSRGLCLVPISSAFPVAGETRVDFWMPNIGGTFR